MPTKSLCLLCACVFMDAAEQTVPSGNSPSSVSTAEIVVSKRLSNEGPAAADAPVKVTRVLDGFDGVYSVDLFADISETIPIILERPATWTMSRQQAFMANPGGSFKEIRIGDFNATVLPPRPNDSGALKMEGGTLPNGSGDQAKDILQVKINTIPDVVAGSILKIVTEYDVGMKEPRPITTYISIDRYENYFAPTVIPFLATSDSKPQKNESPWAFGMATGVEYRFRYRGDSEINQFGNFVEPAFGVHGALLNERDGNVVDLGLGAHFSLFQGWVAGGVGHNFSANAPYFFVGVNLIPAARRINE